MNSGTKLLGILFLSSLFLLTKAQSFEPPKPKMNKNVLKGFIQMHIEYPAESIENGEEGNIIILFSVDKEGTVLTRSIKQSVSKAVDSAALRLFSFILWKPATEYGLPLKSENEFKIRYATGKYKALVKKRGYNKIEYPVKPYDLSGEIYTFKQLDKAPQALLDNSHKNVQDFIIRQLNYPETATRFSITGRVKLSFVIEVSGLPSNILVIKPVGGGCTEEAIRIVRLIKWIPGILDGKAVRTCYNLSIKFNPADELKNKNIPSQSNTGI